MTTATSIRAGMQTSNSTPIEVRVTVENGGGTR